MGSNPAGRANPHLFQRRHAMAAKAEHPVKAEDAQPKDFESALSELEALVASMESGQLSLEQSLSNYRRGMALVTYCQRVLQEAEQQVKILEAGELRNFSREDAAEDDSVP